MRLRQRLGIVTLVVGSWGMAFADGTPQSAALADRQRIRQEDRERALAEAHKLQEERGRLLAESTPEKRREREIQRERDCRLPLPSDGYDWRAIARSRQLTEAEIDQLDRQKLLIGRREFRQSFEVYAKPLVPVFITSDSLLNAFHSLFEDTFRELEIRRVPQLRQNLEGVMEEARRLIEHPPRAAAELELGWLQAQRAVGPALILLGAPLDAFDALVQSDIRAEVQKIRDATAVGLPGWLGPPTDDFLAIDYRRMRPVGFYSELGPLSDYYRAVRWLQIVPFRVERDNELTAIALLAYGANRRSRGEGEFFSDYVNFIGPAAPPGLPQAEILLSAWSGQESWIERMNGVRTWLYPQPSSVNDDLRLVPENPRQPFRVLPPYLLPDAELLQQLVDRNERVSGLHVAALLGSAWAASQLDPREPEFVTGVLNRTRESFGRVPVALHDQRPVYSDYLRVLTALFAPPDPGAPMFMSSEGWAAKSCQTALVGWAQMRHTFDLQAKMTVTVLGLHSQPPGFIEPNPEFFRRFSDLLIRIRVKLEEADVFASTPTSAAARLRSRAAMVDRLIARLPTEALIEQTWEFAEFEGFVRGDAIRELPHTEELQDRLLPVIDLDFEDEPMAISRALSDFSALLRQTADKIERGTLRAPRPSKWTSLSHRWLTLQQTAARLETLVEKQLRRQPWTDEEAAFIKDYGPTLASAMGYFGNMYSPRDDAPRCAEIVRFAREGTSLVVAVGRPRVFYVLYPWNGLEVFCEGAVMPYHEFRSAEAPTDEDWRNRLDSPDAPSPLGWLQIIQSAEVVENVPPRS